ncbi:MAG: RluA family pseudouridine synthase [Candidatus Staskawiczbacteria bacterium]|nr:RluA family pseudouridine synthase [Candidatus Staskawiczbacteria bacterium]MBI3337609.1 RluA family pseudouridine synthase [Candidatus Staskawiczbacteria bacterium]
MKIIYEDNDLLAVDKPAGIVVFKEGPAFAKAMAGEEKTLIDYLIGKYPELKNAGEAPRYGIIHRLDKDTSGILLVAKTTEALIFFQKQFKNRTVEKKYTALVVGSIKDNEGTIETLIGRSPSDKRKQKAYLLNEPAGNGKREAITKYKVLQRFAASPKAGEPRLNGRENYTLLEVKIETGRRHQIRCHLSYIHHPIAGDKMYGFKDSPAPKGLTKQFLHSSYLKIELPSGEIKEFNSDLPEDLKKIINNL